MKKTDVLAELEEAMKWYKSDQAIANVVGVDRATVWRWRRCNRRPDGKVECERQITRAIQLLRAHTKQEETGIRLQRLKALGKIYEQLTELRRQVKLLMGGQKPQGSEKR